MIVRAPCFNLHVRSGFRDSVHSSPSSRDGITRLLYISMGRFTKGNLIWLLAASIDSRRMTCIPKHRTWYIVPFLFLDGFFCFSPSDHRTAFQIQYVCVRLIENSYFFLCRTSLSGSVWTWRTDRISLIDNSNRR